MTMLSLIEKRSLYAQTKKCLSDNSIKYDKREGFDYYLNHIWSNKFNEYKNIQFDYSDGFISLTRDEYTSLLDAINNYSTYYVNHKIINK